MSGPEARRVASRPARGPGGPNAPPRGTAKRALSGALKPGRLQNPRRGRNRRAHQRAEVGRVEVGVVRREVRRCRQRDHHRDHAAGPTLASIFGREMVGHVQTPIARTGAEPAQADRHVIVQQGVATKTSAVPKCQVAGVRADNFCGRGGVASGLWAFISGRARRVRTNGRSSSAMRRA